MRRFPLVFWSIFAAGMACLGASASAAGLFVYAIDIAAYNAGAPSYVTAAPYITWSPASIQANPTGWIPAGQFLVIQTDQLYDPHNARGIQWGVQIFSDNAHADNAGGGPFNQPDYYSGTGFVSGGTVTGPLTPRYTGVQSIQVGSEIQLPKSGLIANDPRTPGEGDSRLPLIWSFYDSPPDNGVPFTIQVPPITQIPDADGDGSGDPCDFTTNGNMASPTCEWFFLRDKGDEKLSGQVKQSIWKNADWYVTPLNREGGLYSVCSPSDWAAGRCNASCTAPNCLNGRFQPTGDSLCDTSKPGCWTSQYVFFAANFRNASAQVYSTTLFVELFAL